MTASTPHWGKAWLPDADRERAAQHRIPVVSFEESWRPYYVIALLDESDPPTDAELAQLRAATETWVRSMYREGFAARMLGMPFAADPGHNTATFTKRDGGWWYRKSTWDQLWDRPLHALMQTPRLDLTELLARFGRNHWR